MDNVPFGWASRIGTIGAVSAVLVPFIPELASTTADLGVPGSTWVWVAALLAAIVVVGRMGQAVVNTIYGGGASVDVPADTVYPKDVPEDSPAG